MSQEQQNDEAQLLREHLFDGDLLELPEPDQGIPGFLPDWWEGSLPALVYPPLAERGIPEGASVDLEITPYHVYYGALRELAETADAERSALLKRAILGWNERAAMEVCELGRFQIEQDLDTAILHYELAQELDDECYEALQDGGMCEYAIANAPEQDREEHLERAEELFRQAIQVQPEAGLSWWSLARVLNDRGAPDEAEAVLHQFLREYPEGEHRDMVESTLVEGFNPPAEDGGDTGAPNEDQAVFQQAQALTFSGEDPGQAVELLEPFAERYPEAAEVWFVLGAAHRRLGDHAESERCLRRAARLAPTEPFVWWELGRAYMEMSQWRPAEDALRKTLEFDPGNPQFLADLGRVLLAQGDREGAEDAIRRAAELVPDDPEIQAAVAELEKK